MRHLIYPIFVPVKSALALSKFLGGLILVIASCGGAASQKLVGGLIQDDGWGEGTIILKNGSELTGLVRFNDKSGVLSYQNGNDSKTLIARSVLGFQFIDPRTGRERVFLTMEYEDRQTSMPVPQFFELVKEYQKMIVLSRVEPVAVKMKGAAQSTPGDIDWDGSSRAIAEQYEVIYFKPHDGPLRPYLEIKHKEVDRILYDREAQSAKVVGADALKEWAGIHYKELMGFVRQRKLVLEVKTDLLMALNHLDSLQAR